MKFFNKTSQRDEKQQRSENRKTKKFMPTYTVGSKLLDEPGPLTEKEMAIHKIKDSVKMHKDGPVSRLFAPLNAQELKTLNHKKL